MNLTVSLNDLGYESPEQLLPFGFMSVANIDRPSENFLNSSSVGSIEVISCCIFIINDSIFWEWGSLINMISLFGNPRKVGGRDSCWSWKILMKISFSFMNPYLVRSHLFVIKLSLYILQKSIALSLH